MLQKPDNILRQINRRIDQVVDVFGVKSPEYMNIKAILGTISGVDSIMNVGGKGQPDKMSRSKRVISTIMDKISLHAELQQAWDAIKAGGSISQLKKRYIPVIDGVDVSKGLSPASVAAGIKEAARKEYESKYEDDDIYEKMQELAEIVAEMGDDELIQDVEDIQILFGVNTGHGNKQAQDDKYDALKSAIDQLQQDIIDKELDIDFDDDDDEVYGNFDMTM